MTSRSIILDNITIMRGAHCTARHMSLCFEPGKITAILGPNGAGKSSLIKAVFGEIPLAEGSISLGETVLEKHKLAKWRDPMGYMAQDTLIEASLTTLEVVLLGHIDALHMHISDEILTHALSVMAQVGIGHLAHRDIQSLSGGQRQLAMFAQVLLRKPTVLLLDEPVSALDMRHQLSLLEQVATETRARNLVTIAVLHDLSLAAQFADNLVLLSDAQVAARGHPRDVLKADLIARLYNVDVDILSDKDGLPVIRPRRKTSPFPAEISHS